MKVILELPPKSPSEVPVKGEAAPAAVISWKFTFVRETEPAVIVLAVVCAEDTTSSLFTWELPVRVRALVTVNEPPTLNLSVATAVPVLVKAPTVPVEVNV